MTNHHAYFLTMVFALLLWNSVSNADDNQLIFKDNDRIALIGNTFVERAQRFGHIETELLVHSKAKNLVFRNLGWSGDSVFNDSRSYFGPPKEGRERLVKAVQEFEPTVVFLCYGTGEAMSINQGWTEEKTDLTKSPGAGLEADLEVFLRGYNLMLENIRKGGGEKLREIVLVTPPPLENLGKPLPDQLRNNQNLAVFSQGIIDLARKEEFPVIDLFNLIGYQKEVLENPFTENGVHYGDAGYRIVAQRWIEGMGLEQKANSADTDVLRSEIIEKNRLFFHRWRPANETYLFLFRKHEQGNNAREIPMFDPLIKEREDKIESLREQINQKQ